MELSKQVANLELSKRLKELGVEKESLFCWYKGKLRERFSNSAMAINGRLFCSEKDYICPAYTVSELGKIIADNENGQVLYGFIGNGFYIGVLYEDEQNIITKRFENDTEANLRAKLLIYLIEQGLINLEEDK